MAEVEKMSSVVTKEQDVSQQRRGVQHELSMRVWPDLSFFSPLRPLDYAYQKKK